MKGSYDHFMVKWTLKVEATSIYLGYPERITDRMVKLNYLNGKFKLKKLI